MRSATSRTLFLLASAAAFAVLAWSAERGPAPRPTATPRGGSPRLSGGLQLVEVDQAGRVGAHCRTAGRCERDVDALLSRFRRREELLRPAGPLRALAALPLARGRLVLEMWRAPTGRLCFQTRAPGFAGDTSGPCVAAADRISGMPGSIDGDRCTAICLEPVSSPASRYWLSGLVSARATTLLVTRDGERVARSYPLAGPLVPGAPRRRAFMLALGRRDWRLLELRRGRRTIERESRPAIVLALERCQKKERNVAALRACLGVAARP